MTCRLHWSYVSIGLAMQAACGSQEPPARRVEEPHEVEARGANEPQNTGAAGSGIALPRFECDAAAEGESKCGETACPPLPEALSGPCAVTCCTDSGQCGVRSAAIVGGLATPAVCVERAVEDSRCPSTMLGTTTLAGCCDFTGHCGQLYGTLCLSSGAGVERACDAPR